MHGPAVLPAWEGRRPRGLEAELAWLAEEGRPPGRWVSLLSLTLGSPTQLPSWKPGCRPWHPLPLHPATLTESSSTLPRREEGQALGSSLQPPLPALPCLSRLRSVPMTGWLWWPEGTSPEHANAIGGGQGKANPGPPPWPQGLYPPSDSTPGSGPGHSPALSSWQESPETWPDSSALPFRAPFTSWVTASVCRTDGPSY